MRLLSTNTVLISVVVVCLAFGLGVSQRRTPTKPCPPEVICDPPRQFDEYGPLPWSDEKARLDNAAINLQHEPNAVMYLIAYGAPTGCVGEALARNRRAKLYLVRTRGVRSNRVITVDGGYREKSSVQIWLWPWDWTKPNAQPTVSPNDIHLKSCRSQTRRAKLGRV
jgi:hypothetical protein